MLAWGRIGCFVVTCQGFNPADGREALGPGNGRANLVCRFSGSPSNVNEGKRGKKGVAHDGNSSADWEKEVMKVLERRHDHFGSGDRGEPNEHRAQSSVWIVEQFAKSITGAWASAPYAPGRRKTEGINGVRGLGGKFRDPPLGSQALVAGIQESNDVHRPTGDTS